MDCSAPAVQRFTSDLDALIDPGARIGIAVSGGPDSIALLLLAKAARMGRIEAATVDHGLRPESSAEAEMVARFCADLQVPHATLSIDWEERPKTALQEQAREARYAKLVGWASERGLSAIATAHHADDQAETLLMRLNRGAGVRGLAAMRPATLRHSGESGNPVRLLRPLLGWRRTELEAICAAAGVRPVDDPSNADTGFERVRVRRALSESDWLDPEALARSAGHLASADAALDWAAEREWTERVQVHDAGMTYSPSDAPPEIRRRIVARTIETLASEGAGEPLRGRELDRLIDTLESGATATLRGVRCSGGATWRFTKAPPRRPA